MPTNAEVREQLTGPGGAFEVITDVVDGVEMKVYKDRLGSLRAIAELAAMRGEQTFLVYGNRRVDFATFFRLANSASAALRDNFEFAHGDRLAVLSANNPEWCVSFWATVNLGGILVGLNGWWKTDEIVYGLQDSGARFLVADEGRFRRIVDHLDELPDLEAVFLVDADPADFGGDARLRRFDELTAVVEPAFPDVPIDEGDYAVIFYTSGTTGRPKGAISSHRNMIANLQNTMYSTIAGSMVSGDSPAVDASGQTSALLTSPLFHVSGCHSSLVVGTIAGVKLVIPEGKVRAREGTESHRRRGDHGVGNRAHHGVAGVRVPGAPRLRHVVGDERGVRWEPVGRRAAAHGARDVPERSLHEQRVRSDRDELGRDGHLRSGRPRQADLGGPAGSRRRPADRDR